MKANATAGKVVSSIMCSQLSSLEALIVKTREDGNLVSCLSPTFGFQLFTLLYVFFSFFLVSKLKQHVHCEGERASANISILMEGHLFKAVLTFPFHQIATPALKIHSLSGGRDLPLPHH